MGGSWRGSVIGEDLVSASGEVDGGSGMVLEVGAKMVLVVVEGGAQVDGVVELAAVDKVDARTKVSGILIEMGGVLGVE